ncbi:MAG: 2Fe-2S iron-sulfur cluster binding domain-containing protein [Lentisphaeria bacterium]|nr:2Fe-2S iron-sulfur cluster binding domain-containing protein [Lentisphaeria bacterium]
MTDAASISLSINDGALTIDAIPGETLFKAFARSRVFLPTACGGLGRCGMCRLHITAGCPEPTDTDRKLLDQETLARGVRLACQTVVNHPMAITIPEAYYTAADYRVKVTRMTLLTRDIAMVRCQAVEPRQVHVEPGAWMFFHCPPYEDCPGGVDRPFSIASDPRDKRNLEFIIRRNPVGVCTKWIFENMQVGDEITLNGPHGDFRLHDTTRDAIFIAGGSGLSAIRSILFEMKNQQSPKKSRLFFGAATCQDLYLLDELRDFERTLPDFHFLPAVSSVRPGDAWDGETGLITTVVARHAGDCSESEAYLCGSPAMVNACINVLTSLGMPCSRIYFDKFG